MQCGRSEDLIEVVDIAELGVGVLGRVEVVNAGDFCEVACVGTVPGSSC